MDGGGRPLTEPALSQGQQGEGCIWELGSHGSHSGGGQPSVIVVHPADILNVQISKPSINAHQSHGTRIL